MTEPLKTKVMTGKVRFSYPHLFQARAIAEGMVPKFSLSLLIPKTDTKTVANIKAAIEAARLGSAELFGGKIPPNLKSPLYDGDGEKTNGGPYGPEAKGCWVINASSKQKPGVVDQDLLPIMDPNDVYPGCYGRCTINFFAYNQAGNKGIGVGLNNVQKLAEGEPLGSRTAPEDDFSAEFAETDDLGL